MTYSDELRFLTDYATNTYISGLVDKVRAEKDSAAVRHHLQQPDRRIPPVEQLCFLTRCRTGLDVKT